MNSASQSISAASMWQSLSFSRAANLIAVRAFSRLRRSDGAAMVRRLLGDSEKLSIETIDEILDRTDGIPLFLEELTKALIEAAPSQRLDTSSNLPVASYS